MDIVEYFQSSTKLPTHFPGTNDFTTVNELCNAIRQSKMYSDKPVGLNLSSQCDYEVNMDFE